jgi:hypothetical protein
LERGNWTLLATCPRIANTKHGISQKFSIMLHIKILHTASFACQMICAA